MSSKLERLATCPSGMHVINIVIIMIDSPLFPMKQYDL